MDLYIAEITRDQMVRLERACAFIGKFYWQSSLHKMWYFNESKIREIFGVASFRQMKSDSHRYLGPVLPEKKGLDAFLADIKVYENDTRVEIDSTRIKIHFKPMPKMPTLTDKNVVVFHGEYYHGVTGFNVPLNEPFALKHLRLNLVDCGDNGYIFQSIYYKKKRYPGREEADSRGFLRPQFIAK